MGDGGVPKYIRARGHWKIIVPSPQCLLSKVLMPHSSLQNPLTPMQLMGVAPKYALKRSLTHDLQLMMTWVSSSTWMAITISILFSTSIAYRNSNSACDYNKEVGQLNDRAHIGPKMASCRCRRVIICSYEIPSCAILYDDT